MAVNQVGHHQVLELLEFVLKLLIVKYLVAILVIILIILNVLLVDVKVDSFSLAEHAPLVLLTVLHAPL